MRNRIVSFVGEAAILSRDPSLYGNSRPACQDTQLDRQVLAASFDGPELNMSRLLDAFTISSTPGTDTLSSAAYQV